MVFKSIIGATCACLAVVSFSANAALIGRDLDGNLSTAEAYYDDVADLTWLADANAAGTRMNWTNANAWAAGLDVAGVTGWRLPDTNPVNGAAYNYIYALDGTTDYGLNVSAPGTTYAGNTGSEMAYLFYNTLGNLGSCDPVLSTASCVPQSGFGLTNTGPFNNLLSSLYWSATEYAPDTSLAWVFDMSNGGTSQVFKTLPQNQALLYAWAVQSGDVGASVVPIPSAIWLFGSGLLGLIGVARRKASI